MMDQEICFIVNKCNFKTDLIEKIKTILKKKGYAPWIAEEVSSFNIDLLEHRILNPLKNAAFIIVLLSPTGSDKKDSNFNVAFEFGYARGIGQNVILLFDGDSKELPADINRDGAILIKDLEDSQILSKIQSLIKDIEEQKGRKLKSLSSSMIDLFIGRISRNDFATFSKLLYEFSYTYKLLDSPDVVGLIKLVINNNSERISSEKTLGSFLQALNNVFTYDQSKLSKNLNKEILPNLVGVLNNTKEIITAKECLNLFIRTDDILYIDYIINFFIKKYPENFEEKLAYPLLEFGGKCSSEYCVQFLSKLTIAKEDISLSKEKKDNLESIWQHLVNFIKQT